MESAQPNRLVIAITQADDADALAEALTDEGFGVTRLNTAGGFLRRENSVMLVATTLDRVPRVTALVERTCHTRHVTWIPPFPDGMGGIGPAPIEVEVGGAVLFTVPIERVEHIWAAGGAHQGGRR